MSCDRRTFLKASGIALVASATPVSLAAAAARPTTAEQTLAGIAAKATRDLASPGIQLAVWRDGRPTGTVADGSANLETATAVAPDTIFRIGSLTKQFTAALIAMLEEQRKLSVHDPVTRHLSFFPERDAPTLLELIHHTAGVHDAQEARVRLGAMSQLDIARNIARQSRLYDFSPGTAWLYSNANYILLGAVVEAVTRQPLSQVALQYIFDPLQLKHTRFDTCADVVRNRAAGYSAPQSSTPAFVNAAFIPIEQAGGAGAMRSNCNDLCAWHRHLFSGKVVTSETLAAVVAPAHLKDGRPIPAHRFNPDDNAMGATSYGYGLLLDRSSKGDGLIAMHSGIVNGFSAYLATHVPTMHTFACICNADPGPNLPFSQLRRSVFASVL